VPAGRAGVGAGTGGTVKRHRVLGFFAGLFFGPVIVMAYLSLARPPKDQA
jgi:hypothetical protein